MLSKDIKHCHNGNFLHRALALSVVLSCGIFCLPSYGQKAYTLDECRTMALQNNIKVRNAANNVASAVQDRKEAFTKYFPNVSATGMGYNANKGLLQLDMAPGMSMSMLKNGIMGGITVTQPVFAGGQILNANRLTEVGVEVSKTQQQQSQDEVRLTVEQYFWQVVVLKEKLNTLHTIETQLRSITHDVETAVKVGVKTRNDLLQVQLKHNDIQSSLINVENNLTICQRMLAQYIGVNTDTIAVACSVSMDTIAAFPNDLRCDHETALQQTTSYRLLESNVRANRLQQKMTFGKNLPTVAIGAGYMYDNLMDKSHPFAIGYVSVSIPISNWWGGSYANRKKKLQVKNAEDQLQDNSQLLLVGMQKSWNDLQNAYSQMLIAHTSISQSAENLRLHKDYYHAGTATISDLLDAQTLFQQSRDKFVDAYAQFQIEKTRYLVTTGR